MQVVRFRTLEKPKEDEFSLELTKLDTYDNVVEEVAQHIGLSDPSKIRLTSHNCYSQQPKPQSIKYRGMEHLSDMLIHSNQTSDILYYEVLDIPLPELQCLKTLKIAFHHDTNDEVVIHTIRLPRHSTVSDVINDLKSKWFVVNSIVPPQFHTEDDRIMDRVNPEYEAWEVQDQMLLVWLQSTLSKSVLSRMLGTNHSYQVWEKIHEHFSLHNKSRARQL
ncbi:Ubiquitin carboxyl-terminal hydrolase 13 [Glycine soja]|uniref:ubiquitinyl hydrolase 1 n=1 Tax=Glycine soja TaxID=3848 RepID=A0A445F208_GLYSO|nr:Ubiquitin carboxyl-terminal hydrolase 13 [Glycine soja]